MCHEGASVGVGSLRDIYSSAAYTWCARAGGSGEAFREEDLKWYVVSIICTYSGVGISARIWPGLTLLACSLALALSVVSFSSCTASPSSAIYKSNRENLPGALTRPKLAARKNVVCA
jgi:hypothetical protein